MSQNSVILKLIALPIAIFVSSMGIMTILGGHITPGGGFQGGAMITAGVIMCILVYGLDKSPLSVSHDFVNWVEGIGILIYIGLGLIGLFLAGSFLYNVGTDIFNVVPSLIHDIFHYQDVTNAGIIPYLNIVVGLKVFVGLSAIVIAFAGFKKFEEENWGENMLNLGAIIFGFLLGVLVGSQIKTKVNDTQFTLASFVIIFIVGVISAWQLGPFPFYTDMPIASGFFFGLLGIYVGKLLFARGK